MNRAIQLTKRQLAKLRRARGDMTQAALGERLGVTSQYITQLEKGNKRPSEEMLKRWARAVGLNVTISLKVTLEA